MKFFIQFLIINEKSDANHYVLISLVRSFIDLDAEKRQTQENNIYIHEIVRQFCNSLFSQIETHPYLPPFFT